MGHLKKDCKLKKVDGENLKSKSNSSQGNLAESSVKSKNSDVLSALEKMDILRH